jgi:hypothetical protein
MAKEAVIYNYQPFIRTGYFGMTEHRPTRVKAVNVTSGESVMVSWDYNLDVLGNHLAAAMALYEKLSKQEGSGTEVPKRVVMCGTSDERGYMFTAVPNV